MGTLMGHVAPGVFLIIAGLWWTVNIFKDFFLSKQKHGAPFQSQPWYPCPIGTKFPFDCALKITGATVGIVMDIYQVVKLGSLQYINLSAQHITMFAFFGLNGAVDFLKYKRCLLPDGLEAASGILTLSIECILFYSHIESRPMLDAKIHLLIFWPIIGMILSILLEIRYRHFVVPSLSRAFFALLHGTWFCQMGFILYPPFSFMKEWNLMDHDQAMFATLIFTWHMAAIFVVMLLIAAAVRYYLKRCLQLDDIRYHLIPGEADGKAIGRNAHTEDVIL